MWAAFISVHSRVSGNPEQRVAIFIIWGPAFAGTTGGALFNGASLPDRSIRLRQAEHFLGDKAQDQLRADPAQAAQSSLRAYSARREIPWRSPFRRASLPRSRKQKRPLRRQDISQHLLRQRTARRCHRVMPP